jgi:hypothetical protein
MPDIVATDRLHIVYTVDTRPGRASTRQGIYRHAEALGPPPFPYPRWDGLEEAVLDFSGCAVIISHDRWFLDRVATRILAFEGDSEVVWCEGNYGAYIEDLKRRKGPDADQPHRIKYKQLVRS